MAIPFLMFFMRRRDAGSAMIIQVNLQTSLLGDAWGSEGTVPELFPRNERAARLIDEMKSSGVIETSPSAKNDILKTQDKVVTYKKKMLHCAHRN